MDVLLKLYSEIYSVDFTERLGEGKDGEVYQTRRRTAVKFLSSLDYYNRELRAYRVLADIGVNEIAGHDCPKLVRADDTLLDLSHNNIRFS